MRSLKMVETEPQFGSWGFTGKQAKIVPRSIKLWKPAPNPYIAMTKNSAKTKTQVALAVAYLYGHPVIVVDSEGFHTASGGLTMFPHHPSLDTTDVSK